MAGEFGQPITDHGDAGGGGDGAAGEADGVVAEKQRRAKPFFAEFLKCRHVSSASMRGRARHEMASRRRIYCADFIGASTMQPRFPGVRDAGFPRGSVASRSSRLRTFMADRFKLISGS